MRVCLSRSEIRTILSSALRNPTDDRLHFERLKFSTASEASERLLCLQNYFAQPVPNNDMVEMELLKAEDPELDDRVVTAGRVRVVTSKMEEIPNAALVDFANADLHIHAIIPSCTQEEILWSTHSECFVALLHFRNRLADDEVVTFRNVWRHCDYSGYLDTFRYSPASHTVFDDIIAMDACEENQHLQVRRDITKAFAGFKSTSKTAIATGKWGCGVFGGDIILKFIQQVIAAELAEKELVFCTFGDAPDKYETILRLIQEVKPTVGWLIEKLEKPTREDYFAHTKEQLELAALA
jgi:hypothetical protein